MTDSDDLADAQAAYAGVGRRISQLRSYASLPPGDPDGLSEEEQDELERLKEWEY